jgi:hypothetical protein
MLPAIHLNGFALATAIVTIVAVGFIWYGPLFGKAWMREVGMADDAQPEPRVMLRGLILMVMGALLNCYAIACVMETWRPTAWRLGADRPDTFYAWIGALIPWAGFVLPMLMNAVAWEQRSWRLFGINAGFQLASLLAAAMILAHWR